MTTLTRIFLPYLNLNAVLTNTASGKFGRIVQIKLFGIIAKKTTKRKLSFSSDVLVAVIVVPPC